MAFEDAPRALAARFASRVATGFLIPNRAFPGPGWLCGALIGRLAGWH